MKDKGARSWILIAGICIFFCIVAGFLSMKNRQDQGHQIQPSKQAEDYLIETTTTATPATPATATRATPGMALSTANASAVGGYIHEGYTQRSTGGYVHTEHVQEPSSGGYTHREYSQQPPGVNSR
jgi:hypothetical protein